MTINLLARHHEIELVGGVRVREHLAADGDLELVRGLRYPPSMIRTSPEGWMTRHSGTVPCAPPGLEPSTTLPDIHRTTSSI